MEQRREGDAFIYDWPEEQVSIELLDVHRKSDEWWAWLTVRTTAPGTFPHLAEVNHNLGAMQSRTSLARHLTERMPGVDWVGILEQACVLTVRAIREGIAFSKIGSIEGHTAPIPLLDPLILYRQTTVLFGDGGAGKSTLGVFTCGLVALTEKVVGLGPGPGFPALFLDWETDEDEIDWRLKCLRTGHGLAFPDAFYRRETAPLHDSARQIKRFIDREGIMYVVVDSIGAACGGDPETADTVLRFFSAVRSLGVGALCIDHVTKRDSGGKPFGSAYKHNAPRLTWELRKQAFEEENVIHLGLFNRKANNGRLHKPFGLRLLFTESSMRFEREDIQDVPELAASLPLRQRILAALRRSSLSTAEIIEIIQMSERERSQVAVRLSEMRRAGQVIKSGEKWGLATYRV